MLDVELAKEYLKKAQDEVAIMGGNNSLSVCLVIFPFYPLNRVIPPEQMCVIKIANSKLI